MADVPTLKSAQGHVAHHETLIAQHKHCRDEGDGVPGTREPDAVDRAVRD